jgi:hypothetical protein
VIANKPVTPSLPSLVVEKLAGNVLNRLSLIF